jgi:LPS O-antigen subunit length determinant protein (WzzB/FepE family)
MTSECKDDGESIDFARIARRVWNGRIWVAAGFVAGLAAAVAVYFVFGQARTARWIMAELPSAALALAPLEEPFDIVTTPSSLASDFGETLADKEAMLAAALAAGLIDRAAYSSDESYQAALERAAAAMTIRAPTDPNSRNRTFEDRYWMVTISGYTDSQSRRLFAELARIGHSKLGAEMLADLEARIDRIRKSQQKQIDDRDREIANAIENAKFGNQARIAKLVENAQIARSLDIASNTLEAQTFANSTVTGVLDAEPAQTPLYLRGYVALEREAELLGKRGDDPRYVDSVQTLLAQKREFETSPRLARAQAALDATPLKQGGFRAVAFNQSLVTTRAQFPAAALLGVPLLLFLAAGFIIALLRGKD